MKFLPCKILFVFLQKLISFFLKLHHVPRYVFSSIMFYVFICKLLKVNTSIVFLVLCHQRKNDGYFVILEVLQKAYHEHAWASRKLYSFLGKNIHWFKGDRIYKIVEYFIWLSRYVSFRITCNYSILKCQATQIK